MRTSPMKTLQTVLSTLEQVDGREAGPAALAMLAGATVDGYAVRRDRKKRRAIIEVRLTVQVPLEPETAVRRPGERRG